jgi:6,7-dimethyl-8-ribityllumazine synthase
VDGATAALQKGGASFEIVSVPGALEIPTVIALAAHRHDGFVALGCVVRGPGFHFELIAGETMAGLARLGTDQRLCIGNGVLACEDLNEAWRLADPALGDAGGDAARACVMLAGFKQRLGQSPTDIMRAAHD